LVGEHTKRFIFFSAGRVVFEEMKEPRMNAKIIVGCVFIFVVLFGGCHETCLDGLELELEDEKDSFEVIDFKNDKERTRIRVVRHSLGNSGGFSFDYEILRFAYADKNTVFCLDAGLDYKNTHHNVDDIMQARYEGKIYEINKTIVFGYSQSWIKALTIKEGQSEEILAGPIALEFDSCFTIPKDVKWGRCGGNWTYD
jgi:hypothetical protein